MTSQAEVKKITSQVAAQYDKALKAGDAFYYESEVHILPDNSTGTRVPWILRNVPALLQKPVPNVVKPEDDTKSKEAEQPQQNKDDVFAPPYVPNLLVKECEEGVVLLNKFCVVPRHFLMVTKDFVPQDLPPPPPLLSLAWRIVTSHPASEDSELLAFFNCGWDSGASQKHCHVQCIEVRREDLQGSGATQSDGDDDEDDDHAEGLIPIERLMNRIEKDGKEHEAVHALPVPWQHFVSLLDAGKAKQAESVDAYLANRLMTLLDTMLQAKRILTTIATETSTKDPSDGSSSGGMMGGGGPPSFNLLLTKRAMHLIPRRQENYTLAGEWPEVNGKKLGVMSINAMGFAGMLLVKHPSEVEAVRKMPNGVTTILSHVGQPPTPDHQHDLREDPSSL